MSPLLSVRRSAAAAASAVLLGLLLAASAYAAPVWGPAEPYGGASATTPTVFLSVSCSSFNNCVAVGLSAEEVEPKVSREQPIVAVESAGRWGSISTVALPSGASTSPEAADQLNSVSCRSASSCVAVGQYRNGEGGTDAIVVPIALSGATATVGAASSVALPAGAAGASTQNAALRAVSCAAGGCTAVGYYLSESTGTQPMIATPSGGEWNATGVSSSPPPGGMLEAISCPSSGPCEAVGDYREASSEDVYPWAVQVTNGTAGTAQPVSLPSDFKPTTALGSALFGLTEDGLDAVSCPSTGVCTAAGSYTTTRNTIEPVAVPIASGIPGTPTELGAGAAALELAIVGGIWCSDATDCVLAGGYGPLFPKSVTAQETSGTWSRFKPIATSEEALYGLATALTCISPHRCIASGLNITVHKTSTASLGYEGYFAESAPQLSVATTSLPAATVGVPYSATLHADGGTGTDTWSIALGSLPAGLSLNAATGTISGTPTTSGQEGFMAAAADPGPPAQTASTGLSITVDAAPAPPSTPSTPQPAPIPTVTAAYLHSSGTKATLVIGCAGAPCAGTIRITHFVKPPKRGERARRARARLRRRKMASSRTITLARGHYSLAPGHTEVVRLTLSKAARRLLARLHRISGHLYVTPTGASRPAIIEKVRFTSRSKAKGHGRHRRHHRHGRRRRRHRKP